MPHRTAEPSEQGVLVLSAFEAEQFLLLAGQSFTHLPTGRAEGEFDRTAGVGVPIPRFVWSTRARPVPDHVHDLSARVAGDGQTYGDLCVEARGIPACR
jgi:hypothetical protein